MPLPDDLQFDSTPPPTEWLLSCPDMHRKARAVHLWETTLGLIHNEGVLSKQPDRFLAMIREHRVSTEMTSEINP